MTASSSMFHHLADILEHDQCISINRQNISSIRAGTYPKDKLENLISIMKSQGCGLAHVSSTDPNKTSRLKTLSSKAFKIFKIDSTRDNIFHAFLHGVSFIVNHRPATKNKLLESSKKLRLAVVESILENKNLQNKFDKNTGSGYHDQFSAIDGGIARRSFVMYSRKMRNNAFASYTELAALSKFSDIEIHIYDIGVKGFVYALRYGNHKNKPKSKKFVIRLVRSRKGDRAHFDLLLPTAFFNHQNTGFWKHIEKSVFGRNHGNHRNTVEKARELLKVSKENERTTKATNVNNLPNEATSGLNNFSWNNSPSIRKNRKNL